MTEYFVPISIQAWSDQCPHTLEGYICRYYVDAFSATQQTWNEKNL